MLPLSASQRRILILAATLFFVSSVYLTSTRLFNMEFTRGDKYPTSSSSSSDKPSDKVGDKHREKVKPGVKLNHADLPMSYGGFNRPKFDNLKLMDKLPAEFVPTVENGRRLIVLGDIHGMSNELESILTKVFYNETRDHLIAVGDMISKGPDSTGVVSKLMSLNASAVRGNHEDRILLARSAINSQHGVAAELESPENQERRGELQDLVTARGMSPEHIKWLENLPVILTIDELSIYVVHAGLVPGVDVESQDPWAVMNMRTLSYPREEIRAKEGEKPRERRRRAEEAVDINDGPSLESLSEKQDDDVPDTSRFVQSEQPQPDSEAELVGEGTSEGNIDSLPNPDSPDTAESPEIDMDTTGIPWDRQIAIPNDGHKGEKWTDAWNSHQLRLPRRQRRTVIYGHDAKTGYKESKYTFGLDSGCVKGEALSALIIEASGTGGFKHKTLQIRCQNVDKDINAR